MVAAMKAGDLDQGVKFVAGNAAKWLPNTLAYAKVYEIEHESWKKIALFDTRGKYRFYCMSVSSRIRGENRAGRVIAVVTKVEGKTRATCVAPVEPGKPPEPPSRSKYEDTTVPDPARVLSEYREALRRMQSLKDKYDSLRRSANPKAGSEASLTLSDEYTDIRKAGISLRLPQGAKRVGPIDAYVVPDAAVSVSVFQLPGPVREHLKRQKAGSGNIRIELLKRREIKVAGQVGYLTPTHGKNYLGIPRKGISLLLGRGDRTVMVFAVAPAETDNDVFKTLEACLRTTRLLPGPLANPLDQLEYSLRPTKDLKLNKTVPDVQATTYREPGSATP